MAISVCEVSITQSPLDLPARENNAAAGAIVDFWGVVRGLEDGKAITGIDYEAHGPMADHQMRSLAETAISKFGLTKVIVRHRIGFVPAAEASIVVLVESSRRSAAFSASQWIMDELKQTVPIWKHPVFKDKTVSGDTTEEKLQRSLDSSSARA
jgi:molybdopterin synthase catalytic subunit